MHQILNKGITEVEHSQSLNLQHVNLNNNNDTIPLSHTRVVSRDECYLSVIIPAYKEAENLIEILPRLNAVLNKLQQKVEIIVVDSMSALDDTPDVCKQNNIKYISRLNGDSYGDAVRTGIGIASGEKIVFMDADGSHDPEFILKMLEYVKDYDLIIASRYVDGGKLENSRMLVYMSRALNMVYSFVLQIKCKDLSNSFKLYNSCAINSLNLKCNNFDIIEEILYKITRNNRNIKIKEIPYTFHKRMFGKSKRNLVLFMVSYLFTIIKLRFFVGS